MRTLRTLVVAIVATMCLLLGVGCSASKKCQVPGCAGLHRGYWEMDHQILAQKIKSGEVTVSVEDWLKARAGTTVDIKEWQDDDLHLKYYIKEYKITDKRKAGWEDKNIFLSGQEIKARL